MDTEGYIGNRRRKIRKFVHSNGSIKPLLISTDNRTIADEELTNCRCSWFVDDDDQSACIVNFANNTNIYQGMTKTNGNPHRSVLVLQHKKTNKVQLVEVGECLLERIDQKRTLQSNYDSDEMDATYEVNKSLLLKAFGSKRSKRASEAGSKMRINSDLMTSQIEFSTADVTVDVKDLKEADPTLDTCLPLCHRNATNVQGVYLLQDFLTQSQLDSMEDEAFTILSLIPFTAEESGYSQFFVDTIHRLLNRVNIEKIQILLFVEALLIFVNLPLRKLKKSDIIKNISPFSTVIGKKILEEFAVDGPEGRTRSKFMDDKIIVHIIVLVVIACDFVCNIDELLKYLPRFNTVKMNQLARALCLTTQDKVNWFLKLPLPLPRSGYIKRRK